ncbi:MAG: hypothetical protein CMK09_17645 [Ponticaulis sp.]|nr:hypothetical protein [Ponticaulis sp.]|tara:strand:- start:16609 stop:17766 length:1158 start_codon:yes stop_codon:yes gene_type:complete
MTLRTAVIGLALGTSFVFLQSGESFATDPAPEQQYTTANTLALPLFRQTPESGESTVSTQINPAEAESPTEPVTTPAPAPVHKPDILATSAIAYGSYQTDVSTFKRSLESAEEIDNVMNQLGTHNASRLATGWLSYSALLASQSEPFKKGVLETEAYFGRDRLLLGMQNSPSYTLSLDGADDAINRALRAGKADANRLETVGEEIKEQAYTLQTLGWAKAKLRGKPSEHAQQLRLASLQGRPQSGAVRSMFISPNINDTLQDTHRLSGSQTLWDQITQTGSELKLPGLPGLQLSRSQHSVRAERRESAGNIATLAALKILGETEVDNSAYVSRALQDPQTQACFEKAQLNLLQCVSASRNVYERPFCIGVHALKEVGECIGEVSN